MNVAAHKRRPPLHPLEKALLTVLSIELIFMPWAFGTMHGWSQITAASLALAAFVLSLLPRNYSDQLSPQGALMLKPWPRLLRFPLFWLGLALLGLLVVQWCNPAWIFMHDGKAWWMKRIPHIEWLPPGTRTPFDRYNLWRSFLVFGAVWLTVCALWVGITRRRTLQLLLAILLGNAVVLALVGFAHRLSGEPKVLWIRKFDAASFSSFVYQNHGGAFFGLLAAAALGLATWHFYESRKRMARSSPTPVWLFVTGFLVFAVLFSFSRGAAITLGVFVVGAAIAFLIVRANNPVPSTTPRLVTALLLAVFVGAAGFVVRHTDFSTIQSRFRELAQLREMDTSVSYRVTMREAAAEMLSKNWVLGTGAGSFRFLYPRYSSKRPELYNEGRIFIEHAHIDWLQYPIEFGLTGTLLIAGAFGWCLWRFVRCKGWRHGLATMLLLGCGQTLLHAAIDFPFQNPAVLMMWWVLLIAALRWLELDTPEPAPARPGALM